MDDCAVDAGVRACCADCISEAADRHVSGAGDSAGGRGGHAWIRHGLFNRDALGTAALRRVAGLRQHLARSGGNAFADVCQRCGDSGQSGIQLFSDFRQMRFSGIGRDGRGDCDGAFALCGNGHHYGLYAHEISSFWLYTRCIQKPARAEAADDQHFTPGNAAAGQ